MPYLLFRACLFAVYFLGFAVGLIGFISALKLLFLLVGQDIDAFSRTDWGIFLAMACVAAALWGGRGAIWLAARRWRSRCPGCQQIAVRVCWPTVFGYRLVCDACYQGPPIDSRQ